MPMIERSITVDKPLNKVWDYLSDFRNTKEWDPPTVTTELESGNGDVGTVYRNVSKFMGHKTEIEYTVIDYEPHRLLRLRGENPSMTAIDTIRFEEAGESTTVNYRAELEPHGVAKLAVPLMAVGLKKLGDDAEEKMRECLNRL